MSHSNAAWLANPNTNAVGLPVTAGTDYAFGGGPCVFSVAAGAFNGATVKLQVLGPDGATWIDAGTACTLTANGFGFVYLPHSRVRVNVAGGTPTGLFAVVQRIFA